jgi:hypothetical protein
VRRGHPRGELQLDQPREWQQCNALAALGDRRGFGLPSPG